ncbi:hypothetical protein VTO42DRAFT_6128 [Malbranchea cinnamomea]
MMVIFQNKIIYMPSMPPFSRSEKIEDYARLCGAVRWEERRIRAEDGVEIALCVGSIPRENDDGRRKHVVVLYFQGNGSSTPPRLPFLSAVLNRLHRQPAAADYTIVALSYRGYWTSRGRPSQKGIERDAIAALRWVQDTYSGRNGRDVYVLWGQSIGAGVATGLVAHHTQNMQNARKLHGMILETPFLSIKSMLLAMYPQRWLPYRYLWPFLRNWWDSEDAVRRIGRASDTLAPVDVPASASSTCTDAATATPTLSDTSRTLGRSNGAEPGWAKTLPTLIISATNDELVPPGQAAALEKLCRDVGMSAVQRVDVAGALHNDATIKGEGQNAVVEFLGQVGESAQE